MLEFLIEIIWHGIKRSMHSGFSADSISLTLHAIISIAIFMTLTVLQSEMFPSVICNPKCETYLTGMNNFFRFSYSPKKKPTTTRHCEKFSNVQREREKKQHATKQSVK